MCSKQFGLVFSTRTVIYYKFISVLLCQCLVSSQPLDWLSYKVKCYFFSAHIIPNSDNAAVHFLWISKPLAVFFREFDKIPGLDHGCLSETIRLGGLTLGEQDAPPYTHVTRVSDPDAGVCQSKIIEIQYAVLIFQKRNPQQFSLCSNAGPYL